MTRKKHFERSGVVRKEEADVENCGGDTEPKAPGPGMDLSALSRTRLIQKTWLPNSIMKVANQSRKNIGPTSLKLGVSQKAQKAINENVSTRLRALWIVIIVPCRVEEHNYTRRSIGLPAPSVRFRRVRMCGGMGK